MGSFPYLLYVITQLCGMRFFRGLKYPMITSLIEGETRFRACEPSTLISRPHRTIPVRQDLEEWIGAYIEAAGIADDDKNAPLFRSAYYRCRRLTERGLSDHTIRMIVKRRLADAGLPAIISPHSFRVMVVTNLLSQNVPIDDVQYLAGHANSQSTQLYDRRRRRVARTIVDLIAV